MMFGSVSDVDLDSVGTNELEHAPRMVVGMVRGECGWGGGPTVMGFGRRSHLVATLSRCLEPTCETAYIALQVDKVEPFSY